MSAYSLTLKNRDLISNLTFDHHGLLPVVVQDAETGGVLMLAYMNRESLEATLKTGNATYWSRSRNMLWMKGETSGNVQKVTRMVADCDGDALLLFVHQVGNACHTGERSCFHQLLAASKRGQRKNSPL